MPPSITDGSSRMASAQLTYSSPSRREGARTTLHEVSRDLDPGHCGQSCRPPPSRDPNDARDIRHNEIEGAHRKGAAHRLRHVEVLTDLKRDGQILGNCRVAAVAVMTDRFSSQTIASSRSARPRLSACVTVKALYSSTITGQWAPTS
jgi:hypothetical protein